MQRSIIKRVLKNRHFTSINKHAHIIYEKKLEQVYCVLINLSEC